MRAESDFFLEDIVRTSHYRYQGDLDGLGGMRGSGWIGGRDFGFWGVNGHLKKAFGHGWTGMAHYETLKILNSVEDTLCWVIRRGAFEDGDAIIPVTPV